MKIHAVNGSDSDWTSHRYVLAFGAYGSTRLMVWANGLEDALDECVDWIAEYRPGLLYDDEVAEAYQEALDAGESEESALEMAEIDMIRAGNCSNYVASWEWCIVAEDPTRAQIKEMLR